MRAHGENEISLAHEIAGEGLRSVRAQVHVALHADEEGAIRGRCPIPRAGASARDLHLRQSALDADLARDRLGERTTTGVAGADEQNLHAITRLRSGWARSRATLSLGSPRGE